MPRRARIVMAGLPVHVVHRGNNRQACFHETVDRAFYLFHLRRLLAPSACELHAYCLMTNHVHLLLTPQTEAGCATLMRRVSLLHTQYMNRKYARTGTLWEGRFHSSVVQCERYLLACYRYIEANPLRAGICGDPGDYEWSSYRVNVGESADRFITPHEEYGRLGSDDYKTLFASLEAEVVTDIRKAVNGNFAVGDEIFKRQLAERLGKRVDAGKPGRPSAASDGDGKRGPSLI